MPRLEQQSLFDTRGSRKYLCGRELPRFLDAARRSDMATLALCSLLAYTGCRVSEALAVTSTQLDEAMRCVVFRTLKRRRPVFRAVPVPRDLMQTLVRLSRERGDDKPLWSWSRQTAWRRIKRVMQQAGISGTQASPKGLRHGFGVANAEGNVPMATTQKWLGHASLESTAVYQQAVGREEHAFARRVWKNWRE